MVRTYGEKDRGRFTKKNNEKMEVNGHRNIGRQKRT